MFQLACRSLGVGLALPLLFDHVLGRAGDELLVGQLGVDLLDLVADLVDLSLQAVRFGADVDDAVERHGDRRLFEDDLDRAHRRRVGEIEGLNAGEPILEGDDLFGTTVQLAARITDRAQPGQVLVSNVVRELCAGKELSFESLGEVRLKGFRDSIALYLVTNKID